MFSPKCWEKRVCPGGVISLQYADDILIFLEANVSKSRHLKWLLACFEAMSRLRINFHKTDLMTMNSTPKLDKMYAGIFCCKIGSFPFKYLGVPLHYTKLRKEDLQPLVDKIFSKLSGWRGRTLSYGKKINFA